MARDIRITTLLCMDVRLQGDDNATMSLDASKLQFFEYVHLDDSPSTWIEEQLLRELPRIATGIPWPAPPTSCLLADMGHYLVRILHVLASFAESLLENSIISDYLDARIEELAAENDLSTANDIDDKHAALKKIASKLRQALKDCESYWSFTLSTPGSAVTFQEVRGSEYTSPQDQIPIRSATDHMDNRPILTYQTNYSMPAQQLPPGQAESLETDSFASYSGQGSSENPALDDDRLYQSSSAMEVSDSGLSPSNTADHLSGKADLKDLKARGKGNYTCPRGYDCKKGGVQPNGDLTIFERNSAFRAHLQLHERAFKCNIPGCTNKKGFARIDQLERHKTMVKHQAPGWVIDAPP